MEGIDIRAGANSRRRLWLAVFFLGVLSLALSACGGDGNDSSTSGQANSGSKSGSQSPQGTAGDFGSAATSAQAQPIEAAAHRYLAALAASEWSRACSYLAAPVRNRKARLAKAVHLKPPNCAGNLRVSTKNMPRVALAKARVSSVRVGGDRAYVILSEADGAESTMGMRREAADWEVVGSIPVRVSSR